MSDLNKTQLIVRQANALAKSAQLMELNEKRLLLLAMSRIRYDDKEILTHDIPITELAEWLGGSPYHESKKAADGLLERVVHVQGEDGAYSKFQWTTLSRYIPASQHPDGVACIRVRLNEELKPWLLLLREKFNSIPLTQLLPIPSFNSQRLYEILWHDSHAGKNRVLTYDIQQLKVLLGLRDQGGKWEKYQNWKDFKKVLERAQKDLETFGVLHISSYDGLKDGGRAYTHVRFALILQESASPGLPFRQPETYIDPEVERLAQELAGVGYRQNAYEAIATYGLERVQATLDLARESERKAAKTSKPIHNLGGLIHDMLKRGVAQKRSTSDKNYQLPEREVDSIATTIRTAFAEARSTFAKILWDGMSSYQQASIHDLMQVVVSEHILTFIERDNWQGKTYETARNLYIIDSYLDEFPDELLDIQEFIKQHNLLKAYDNPTSQRILKRIKYLQEQEETTA